MSDRGTLPGAARTPVASATGRAPRPPERRRVLAVGLVVVLVVLGGVANATIHPGRAGRGLRLATQSASVVVTNGATSSAWYCAGPLPTGTPGAASSIAVTNTGSSPVDGEVVVSSTRGGRPSVTHLDVRAGQESVVGLTRHGVRAASAATVLVNGSGIAVEEIVHGAGGLSAAPCSDRAVRVAYLAAGSTLGANNESLAVLDPGSTPSVVSLSFATTSGMVAPPPFQGVNIAAGGVAVFDVGHFVPSAPAVAAVVNATGGRVVAGAAVTAVVGSSVMSSLVGAVATSAPSWLFPAGPTGPTTASTFAVLDPSDHAATVHLQLASSTTRSEITAVVPAHGVVHLVPGVDTTPSALRWASLTSVGANVVAARETVLVAAVPTAAERRVLAERAAARRAAAARAAASTRRATARAAAAARSHRRSRTRAPVASTSTTPTTSEPSTTTTVVPYAVVTKLPAIQPGVAVSSGVSSPSRAWVLPGGESDAHTSEVVLVDNTSQWRATVEVGQLDGAGSGRFGTTPFASMPHLSIAAGAILTVDLATIVGEQPALPLLISASEPVVVGQMLYGRSAPSSGFTLPAAISVR